MIMSTSLARAEVMGRRWRSGRRDAARARSAAGAGAGERAGVDVDAEVDVDARRSLGRANEESRVGWGPLFSCE